MKKNICFFVILVIFAYACRKPIQYSDIPAIRLINFEKYQDEKVPDGAKLTFYFQDGNGDIGLDNMDTLPPFNSGAIYYYNFFCDYYEKREGIFVKIDSIETSFGTIPLHLNGRIPRLSNLSQESINGEICHIMPDYYVKNSIYDTLQMRFYIVDRKLNHSNIEEATMVR